MHNAYIYIIYHVYIPYPFPKNKHHDDPHSYWRPGRAERPRLRSPSYRDFRQRGHEGEPIVGTVGLRITRLPSSLKI